MFRCSSNRGVFAVVLSPRISALTQQGANGVARVANGVDERVAVHLLDEPEGSPHLANNGVNVYHEPSTNNMDDVALQCRRLLKSRLALLLTVTNCGLAYASPIGAIKSHAV